MLALAGSSSQSRDSADTRLDQSLIQFTLHSIVSRQSEFLFVLWPRFVLLLPDDDWILALNLTSLFDLRLDIHFQPSSRHTTVCWSKQLIGRVGDFGGLNRREITTRVNHANSRFPSTRAVAWRAWSFHETHLRFSYLSYAFRRYFLNWKLEQSWAHAGVKLKLKLWGGKRQQWRLSNRSTLEGALWVHRLILNLIKLCCVCTLPPGGALWSLSTVKHLFKSIDQIGASSNGSSTSVMSKARVGWRAAWWKARPSARVACFQFHLATESWLAESASWVLKVRLTQGEQSRFIWKARSSSSVREPIWAGLDKPGQVSCCSRLELAATQVKPASCVWE